MREEISALSYKHEEADTCILWHLKHMSATYHEGRVVVRSCDTDVLIFLLTHASLLDLLVWLVWDFVQTTQKIYKCIASDS